MRYPQETLRSLCTMVYITGLLWCQAKNQISEEFDFHKMALDCDEDVLSLSTEKMQEVMTEYLED